MSRKNSKYMGKNELYSPFSEPSAVLSILSIRERNRYGVIESADLESIERKGS
jgi:hypothetical protein